MDEIYDACENLYVPSEAHTGHCHHEEVQKLLISIELLIHLTFNLLPTIEREPKKKVGPTLGAFPLLVW